STSPRSRTRTASSSSRRSRAPPPASRAPSSRRTSPTHPSTPPARRAPPPTPPTYRLLKTKYNDQAKADLVKGFARYLLTDGQSIAKDVNFAALPGSLQQKAATQLDKGEG